MAQDKTDITMKTYQQGNESHEALQSLSNRSGGGGGGGGGGVCGWRRCREREGGAK